MKTPNTVHYFPLNVASTVIFFLENPSRRTAKDCALVCGSKPLEGLGSIDEKREKNEYIKDVKALIDSAEVNKYIKCMWNENMGKRFLNQGMPQAKKPKGQESGQECNMAPKAKYYFSTFKCIF